MNRYLKMIARIGTMQRWRLRIAALLGCAALTMVVLWAGRAPTVSPFSETVATPEESAPKPGATPVSSPATSEASERTRRPLPGLDSSLSPVPRKLHLVSTSPGRNARKGTARLGVSPENPQTYAAGAVLISGARLAEVYRDRVVLERRGQRATLYVGGSADAGVEGVKDLAMAGGTRAEPSAPTFTEAIDPLVEVVRAMPFYENEVLAGVQVFAGRKSAQFAALGLRSQDVIVAIDGAPVFDAGVTVKRLSALTSGASLTVTVRRGAETKQLTLDSAAIAESPAQPIGLQPGFPAAPLP